jgi:hypothetical protein
MSLSSSGCGGPLARGELSQSRQLVPSAVELLLWLRDHLQPFDRCRVGLAILSLGGSPPLLPVRRDLVLRADPRAKLPDRTLPGW